MRKLLKVEYITKDQIIINIIIIVVKNYYLYLFK